VKRLAKLGERERVRGRAIEDKVNFAIAFENFADTLANASRPSIVSIWCCLVHISFLQSRPRLWTNRGRIIAGEFVSLPSFPHVDLANRLRLDEQPGTAAIE
jgi:hypothetical protein